MKKIFYFLIVLIFSRLSLAQIVVTEPEFPTENDSIVVIFDATQPGAEELLNYTGTVYAHTGVLTNLGGTVWQHVIGQWGNNQTQPSLSRLGANLYKLVVGFPRPFYGLINPAEIILDLAIVFRSADGTKQTRPDIFIPVYEPGLNIVFENPVVEIEFGDPLRSPAFVKQGSSVLVDVEVIEIGTDVFSLTLFVDNIQVAQSAIDSLSYLFNYNNYNPGAHDVLAVAVDTSGGADSASFVMFVNPPMVNQPPPAGIQPGINIINPTTVTFMLFAPDKDFVYLIGDFNDWKVETQYFLNRWAAGADDVVWWITLNNVSPGVEYAFQYFVDGDNEIRIGDPLGHKVLDPWNDQYIDPQTYPNLKPYPQGKTHLPVTTFQTGLSPYPWLITNFQKPPKEKLVIYELLLRDFLAEHDYKTLRDTLGYLKKLGVNAVELMPVMEFEGNISWGYNPMYHLAADKYYGPSNDLKSFIDSAHSNGIAVILDMVLNHAFGLSPLVKLYWDESNTRPAANSPYFNQIPTHPFNVGYDFNHESPATQYFVDRVNRYWLEEFKFDGFRFDLSKGFTQFNSGGNVGLWSQYDQSRIDILKRMADSIWAAFPDAYVILEHFAENSEETVLSDYGMMLWGNMNYEYNEATMGYASNLSNATHHSRGWNDMHLVSYMESHDEERLMYKNLQYGNSSGSYNIKSLPIAIQRIKLAAAFYLTIPGPKMIWKFGELGYDYSINWPCMTEACRLDPKPPRWDYFNDGNRRNLYKVFEALIKLRDYDAFHSQNYNYSLSTYTKRFTILHSTMNVNIIGNFNVTPMNINPQFPNSGWWYDYFNGDSINVSDTQAQISLEPGEFHIYTTVKLPTPEPGILLDVETVINSETVTDFKLEQNFPNPFNSSTKINFIIPTIKTHSDASLRTTLKVYDVLGNEVVVLVDDYLPAGRYEVAFDASDLTSGVYFYTLNSGDYYQVRKMILMK
jgi:1,4-alpha-glucan branching enzyme